MGGGGSDRVQSGGGWVWGLGEMRVDVKEELKFL